MRPHDHEIWKEWKHALRKWRMQEFVAWLLEATGPVNLVGAQVVYVGQPLLGAFIPKQKTSALARVLEEPETTQAFVRYLREANLS